VKRVLLFSFFIAIPAAALNVPCSSVGLMTEPLLRLYAPPGQQPMILLLHSVSYGAAFGPATIEWTGFQYEITQRVEPSSEPGPTCNLATVQLPPGDLTPLIRYTWYYERNGAQTAIKSAEAQLGPHDLDLTVVPTHPDASTPVSLVSHYSGWTLSDVPVPRRNGANIDVRESLAFHAIAIAPPHLTRTALLGLLPPGAYDVTWSIQYPELVPQWITQRHLTFTVDPIPRRRSTGGGLPAKNAVPCEYSPIVTCENERVDFAQPATLRVFPEPAVAGTPLVAVIDVAGPGEQPEIAAAQPWVRVDGSTIFIDLEELEPHRLTGVCPIPPLAPGTYDVVISVHDVRASIHRTRTTLVVPSAGE
jgi:hypothetical protein